MNNRDEISFPLIQKKKTITYKIVIGITIGLGLITIIEGIEKNEYTSNLMVITVLFLIASQIFLDIRSLRIKEYQIVGKISLHKNEIILKIDSNKFEKKYLDIKSVKITVDETSRDPISMSGVVGAGIFNRKRDGVENTISIELENNDSFCYNFLIEDINTFYLLDDFLKIVEFKYKLQRKGRNIHSIKEEHLKDYPTHYVDTSK